jgi:membrane protease YdiL (CAAX protease family)
MTSISDLESRVANIESRNKLVEENKAWETSWTRKILLIIFTYFAIALYLKFILNLDNPWLNAIVPAVGFLLSTLTLPWFKSLWSKYIYKK